MLNIPVPPNSSSMCTCPTDNDKSKVSTEMIDERASSRCKTRSAMRKDVDEDHDEADHLPPFSVNLITNKDPSCILNVAS